MTDVFISYKREDRQKARAIAAALAKTGLDVWWDIELLPGQRFADEINAVIDQAKAAVVLWTPKSIASHRVIAEAAHALQRDILVPAWIEHVELPVPFNTLHTLDLTKWNGTPTDPLLEGLIAGIQRLVGRPEDSLSTRSQSEIETALAKPAHEVEFWTSVSKKEPQSINEYRLYLEKYGSKSAFSELAKLRISELTDNSKKRTRPSVTATLTILGVAVGIILGILQIKQIIWPDSLGVNPEPIIEPKKALTPKACRDPSHGIERYARSFNVERSSNWMGGGYDQNKWCNDVIASLRGEYQDSKFEVVSKSENTKNTCAPFNCPQYMYFCTVKVDTDPIYIEKISDACK